MNFGKSYIATALTLLLASCSSGDEPGGGLITEDNPVLMSFSVTVDNSSPATRSLSRAGQAPDNPTPDVNTNTWGSGYLDRDGNEFENALLGEGMFHPVICEAKADGSMSSVGNFTIMSYWSETTDSKTTYFLHGKFVPADLSTVEDLKTKTNIRLMVFANVPEADFKTDYGNITFSHISDGSAASTSPFDSAKEHGFDAIPMWGVAPVDFSGLKQGSMTQITPDTPCALLRAMAKVEVKFNLRADQKGRAHITSLQLNRYNPSGFVAAGQWDKASTTTGITFTNSFRENSTGLVNPTTDATTGAVTPAYATQKVIHTDAAGENCFVELYLPEIANDDADPLELTVNYEVDGVAKSNHLYFTPYEGGGPKKDPATGAYMKSGWNVVRNHIYEYTITGVQDAKITIEARVKDWQYHKSTTDLE